MVGALRYRIIALFRSRANRGEVEVRKIGIGTLGRIRLPEDVELTSGRRARQPRCEEAVIIVRVDPNRSLRGIVAMICRSPSHGADVSRTCAADGAGKQHDTDVGRLAVDGEAA